MKQNYGIREVANLAGLSPGTITNQISAKLDNLPNKRGKLLKDLLRTYDPEEIRLWGKNGIPKKAVIRILKYYSFESVRNTREKAYKNYCRLTKKKHDPTKIKAENVTDKIYLIVDRELQICKIGSSFNPQKRLETFSTMYPFFELELLSTIAGDRKLENKIHKKFQEYNLNKEFFYITEDILTFFNVKNYTITKPNITELIRLLLDRPL